MKRYLASGGLILASIAYVLFQHAGNDTEAATLDTAPSASTDTTVTTSVPQASPTGAYKDGSYTGLVADAFYGSLQVEAIISGGRIADVKVLQYPNDRSTSRFINGQALPTLTQEAITAQTANVDIVSGASDSSSAFRQSLSSALSQAKA